MHVLKSQSNLYLLFISGGADRQPQDFRESGQQSREVELHVLSLICRSLEITHRFDPSAVCSVVLQIRGELQQLAGVSGSVGQAAERSGSAALTSPGLLWAGPAGLWDPVLTGGHVWHGQDRWVHTDGYLKELHAVVFLVFFCTVHTIQQILVDPQFNKTSFHTAQNTLWYLAFI